MVVESGEPLERFIDGNNIRRVRLSGDIAFMERCYSQRTAAFGGASCARVIQDDLPHGFGGDGEEVLTVLNLEMRMPGELHVGFVHESGRLERTAIGCKPAMRPATKLIINERHQAMDGLAVAAAPRHEQLADLLFRHCVDRRRLYRLW
jgi:hypothetical protein